MKIELIRDARPQGVWLSLDQFAADITSRSFVLEPGDKLFVTKDEPPKLSVVRARPRLSLVDTE